MILSKFVLKLSNVTFYNDILFFSILVHINEQFYYKQRIKTRENNNKKSDDKKWRLKVSKVSDTLKVKRQNRHDP